ncbi:amidohydrolase family protein [Mycetocola zhadangensis]|uniref:Hydrolase n=1 Tax=Mycetocola zhadangensis TaxID=1164595 RepID=A0A3L7IWW0_9MICO|nr:amidohydrolase family protein [Mycetocola zhadangensis]RLQ82707.1 hydrolase [Mycetocola zhadangensis]GGE98882.1 metal-dependent hydrolase [Mycetocola zhadangensis]
MNARPLRIDAHMHLWDLTVSEYNWLGPQFGELNTSWSADQGERELRQAGLDGAILVQAEDSRVDTQFMLDVADLNDWVFGVVGWISLESTDAASADLDRWSRNPKFSGIRHLVNDDPRDDFLDLPEVRASLALVAERGLTFDVHDAWPRHLDRASRLASALPQLTVVLDHLAKPPREQEGFVPWKRGVKRFAERENTVGKLSSLSRTSTPPTADALREVFDFALESFGADRLMYGGDWPMTVLAGGYEPTWTAISTLISELSPTEQHAILGGTAHRVYAVRAN